MGMREWCNHWWTISSENLRSICGPELAAAERHVFDDEWYRYAGEDMTPDDKPFMDAVAALEKRFHEVTGGLELVLLQYDEEMDGTRGAEVDPYEGVIFGVTGVTSFTPAGSRTKHLLRESTWSDAG